MWYLIDFGVVILCLGIHFYTGSLYSPIAMFVATISLMISILAFGHVMTMAINETLHINHGDAGIGAVTLHELMYMCWGATLMWCWRALTDYK